MKTVDDYLALLPSANVGKPLLAAAISAAVAGLVAAGAVADSLPAIYDLDAAVGAQLDTVGIWVGFSRNLSVPIPDAYFSLDVDGLGLDQGYLIGPGDPTSGIVSLDDATYRLMLRVKIAANHWDGSLAQAQQILEEVVATSSGTLLMVIDNFDMSITLSVAGIVPGQVFISLLKNYPSLIPTAVALRELTVTSVSGTPLFGLDVENDYVSGLDVGALGTIY